MIKSGAFDSLHGFENRSSLVASIEEILRSAKQDRDDHQAGQGSLFGGGEREGSSANIQTPQNDQMVSNGVLEYEREVLGIWVSGHPLVESKEVLDQLSRGRSLKDLSDMQHDANVCLCVCFLKSAH